MKFPIIKYNDKFLNYLSWFMEISGISLCPFIILRERYKTIGDDKIINHETIHIKQQLELLLVVFLLWYGIEYLIRLCVYRSNSMAYKNISFERESYTHEYDKDYLKNRKLFSWIKYL